MTPMCLARWSTRAFALGLFALAFSAVGCGSGEKPPAAAPPAAQMAPGGAPSPAAAPQAAAPEAAAPEPAAEDAERTGEVPSDFPADIPRYPGAKVTSARGTEDLGVAVTFDSPDAVDVVAKFYADGLAAQGWQAQTQQDASGTLIIADKDNRRAHAVVHTGDEGTQVEIIVIPVQ